MKLNFEHFKEVYEASFQNRIIIDRVTGQVEKGIKYYVQTFLYALSLILKVVLAPFFKVKFEKKIIFVSWNALHSRLGERIGQKDNLFVIHYGFSKDQIALYRNVSITLALKYAFKIMASRKRADNSLDNIFFCFASMLEFQMMERLTAPANHIYMAGQVDRYAIMLSILAREYKKRFSFVQHGVNNVFEGLYLLRADEIYYLFESSIPFFGAFVQESHHIKYFPIPLVKPTYKTDLKYRNAIGFASQILESDLDILDIIVDNYSEGDIIIYPHPTEKSVSRFKKYEKKSNVFLCREKISNIKYLVSSGSTLGLEYDLIGVPPVFINMLNIKSEIFLSKKFIAFEDIDSFKKWFQDSVSKKHESFEKPR